jgi:hypothetical protein
MRGNHLGSFEVAYRLARERRRHWQPVQWNDCSMHSRLEADWARSTPTHPTESGARPRTKVNFKSGDVGRWLRLANSSTTDPSISCAVKGSGSSMPTGVATSIATTTSSRCDPRFPSAATTPTKRSMRVCAAWAISLLPTAMCHSRTLSRQPKPLVGERLIKIDSPS